MASAEPDERKRGDYGGLALVFADLADRLLVWKEALKGWNMKVSKQVLEWQQEGEIRGELRGALRVRREYLRKLLEHRFGSLPEVVLQRIEGTDDMARLQHAFDEAFSLQRLEDLPL